MKTLSRYYGGKTNMIQFILPLIPPHATYIEPFCGGASVLFHKPPADIEIINDHNDNVINFYKVCKHKHLLPRLDYLVQSSLRSKDIYETTREIYKNPNGHSKVERAWAFWYQCNFSFQSTINSDISICDRSAQANIYHIDFTQKCKRLLNVNLEKLDAISIMQKHKKRNPFCFIDPPYRAGANQGHYTGYTDKMWNELLTYLQDEFTGKFMLTSYDDATLKEYSQRNNWTNIKIQQKTSGNIKINKPKTEIITLNYKTPQSKLF